MSNPETTVPDLEARARSLAEWTIRGSYMGSQTANARMREDMRKVGADPSLVPPPLTDEQIMAEVDRDWHLYAELIEEGRVGV
jgi:hypothetical protein